MAEKIIQEVWPEWKTVKVIGRGGFGEVYEVERDIAGLEKAAVKRISIPQDNGAIEELYASGYDDVSIRSHLNSYLRDILKEYRLMNDLKGKTNIVSCDDVRYEQHEDGVGWDIYIRMELLTPLMKALDQVDSEKQIIKLGKDICNALILCKSRNIVHRDIKPQNIFISKDGDYKLGDFGIAKTMEKTSGATKIGTYEYMAPEVYNNKPYGEGADIYSLGMVMYWLLNERRSPFNVLPPRIPTAEERENARERRFSGEQIPEPANGSCELKRIVLKACAFEPKNRYASAREMLSDLDCITIRQTDNTQEKKIVEEDFCKEKEKIDYSLNGKDVFQDSETVGVFQDRRRNSYTTGEPSLVHDISDETEIIIERDKKYSEAEEKVRKGIEERQKNEISRKDDLYFSAKMQMSRNIISQYESAIKTFQLIPDWKDAKEQIAICKHKIEKLKAKEEAARLKREQQEKEKRIAAEETVQKRKKAIIVVLSVIAFVILLVAVIIPSVKYNSALKLYDAQKYDEAYKIFNTLNYRELKYISVGSTIRFGAYEQDNNTSNGKEEIEWKVLAVEGNNALLISRYSLDSKPFHNDLGHTTWDKCTLRTWLNGTFFNVAFSTDHQKRILDSTVIADKNPSYATSSGKNTMDKVFLLSISEANQYFETDDARKCAPTDYAIEQGAWTDNRHETDGRATGRWWLRSVGRDYSNIALVYPDGTIYYKGLDSNSEKAVRPALWINLDS